MQFSFECSNIDSYNGFDVAYWGEREQTLFHGLSGIAVFWKNFKVVSVYEGPWIKHEPCGSGLWRFSNGKEYLGEVFQGKWHGKGELTNSKKDTFYKGEFKNGLKCGYGKLRHGKETYVGDFLKGKFHGFGVIVFADIEDCLIDDAVAQDNKANMSSPMMHWMRSPLTRLTGRFSKHDKKKDAIAVPKLNGFKHFSGIFVEGKIHGVGKMVLANGVEFEGKFEENKVRGIGIVRNPALKCELFSVYDSDGQVRYIICFCSHIA